MSKLFIKELQERFPDYTITPLGNTHHTNVMRLSKDGYPSLIAKTIWHDVSNPEGDMGVKVKDKAYHTEVKILKILPKWWGLHHINNFKTSSNRVIIINEIKNIPWSSYKKGTNDVQIATMLLKQIRWLHAHKMKIAHMDLLLKNILLTESETPVIIDFEKSTASARKEHMDDDYRSLLDSLSRFPNTKSIGNILQRMYKKKSETRRTRKIIK